MKKYQRAPLPQQIGTAILRGLVSQYGVKQVVSLLEQYFSSDGDNSWYSRNGHSMEVFAKNVGPLNAMAGKKEKTERRYQQLMISVDSHCPHCNQYFKLVLNAKDVGNKTHFTPCPSCSK